MLKLTIIGLGGFVGAVGRYLIGGLVQRQCGTFPGGTLAVNVLGCFLLGAIMHLVESHTMFTPTTRLFVTIGILGAFTTFSTFGYETYMLISSQEYIQAFLNIAGNLLLGLLAVWLGITLMRATFG